MAEKKKEKQAATKSEKAAAKFEKAVATKSLKANPKAKKANEESEEDEMDFDKLTTTQSKSSVATPKATQTKQKKAASPVTTPEALRLTPIPASVFDCLMSI